MKKFLPVFAIILTSHYGSAQITSLTATLGMGKLFESTQIPSGLPEQLQVRAWPSGHLHPFYNLRLNFSVLNQEFSTGLNNSAAGIGIYWKAADLNSEVRIKHKLYTAHDFTQLPILWKANEMIIPRLSGKKNDLCLNLFVGIAFNKISAQTGNFDRLAIYEKRDVGADTIGYDIINKTAAKTGIGLVGELYICRRSKIFANHYSRLFGKISVHQGLTKLADTNIHLRVNTYETSFTSLSRGSFFNLTVGTYLFKRK